MARRRKKNWGDIYSAQVVVSYTPLGPVNHLKVRRHDGGTNHLTWDELMVIKNEMLGQDALAVKIFPRDCDVVNEANVRHLWELPDGFGRRPPRARRDLVAPRRQAGREPGRPAAVQLR